MILPWVIIGYAEKYDAAGNDLDSRGVCWLPGSTDAVELQDNTIDPYGLSEAKDVNASGVIAGTSVLGNAVRWDPLHSTARSLAIPGFTTYASGINDQGFVVGTSISSDRLTRTAICWTPAGDVIDLNTLLDPDSGWNLTAAFDISNTGWIYGRGAFDPDGAGPLPPYNRNFVIQVPEPATASTILLLGGYVAFRRQRAL